MSVGSADIGADLTTSAASVDDVATKSKSSCTDSLSTAKDCAKSSKRLKRLRSRRNNEDKQIIEEGWENSHEAGRLLHFRIAKKKHYTLFCGCWVPFLFTLGAAIEKPIVPKRLAVWISAWRLRARLCRVFSQIQHWWRFCLQMFQTGAEIPKWGELAL